MFNKILVPLDGSSLAEGVLPHLIFWTHLAGAKVILLHALEHSTGAGQVQSIDPIDWQFRQFEAEAYLKDVYRRLREAGLTGSIDQVLVEGRAPDRIMEYAQEHAVDLIVLSSHGHGGLSGWNISSVVQKVVTRAWTSLLLVRAYQPEQQNWQTFQYRRILTLLDGSQRAESVLPLLYRLSQKPEIELMLVHVVVRSDIPSRVPLTPAEHDLIDNLVERNRTEMTKYFEQLKARFSNNVQTRVLINENIATALHQLVEDEMTDLVLLSAHGYSGETKHPYGNISTNFISHGTSPLLIIQDLSHQEMEPSLAERLAHQDDNERRTMIYDDKDETLETLS